jgi:ABC-type nickel/cobalt efflux system permease component RcnA
MSKFEPRVGDEFPLDESATGDDRHAWKEEYRARRREFRHHRRMHRHHGHHHGHHRRHGFGGLPAILILAGVAALVVTHQFTAPIGYGLIGGGAALLVLMFAMRIVWHRRLHRQMHTPSQVA